MRESVPFGPGEVAGPGRPSDKEHAEDAAAFVDDGHQQMFDVLRRLDFLMPLAGPPMRKRLGFFRGDDPSRA